MSMFQDGDYLWRETYFVLFQDDKQPSCEAFRGRLAKRDPSFEFRNVIETPDGRLESMSVVATNDCAAVDVCLRSGPEVQEETDPLLDEVAAIETDKAELIASLRGCGGRFDLLHFERIAGRTMEEELDDVDDRVDPNALLVIIGELVALTGGVAIDPQGGTIIENF